MIRVLHVLGGLGSGGTESLIMSWYRIIDRTKIQFDFLVRSDDANYAEEIRSLGGRVFYTPSFPRHFLANRKETEQILRRKEWEIIHVHGNAAMYILPLKLAKKLHYPCRIMHSHSVKAQNRLFEVVHQINKRILPKLATHFLACSHVAGKWMFDTPYQLMHNAVNTDAFRYDPAARTRLREQYSLENKFVVGHVGRFATPKNHLFLLEVFHEFWKCRPDSVLILVGDGELEASVRKKTSELGLEDHVLFMGRRSDVGQLMSAMDLFLLPSLYEGLPVALVEAQFNGLPCLTSKESFSEEARLTASVSVLPLDAEISVWAQEMYRLSNLPVNRHISKEFAASSGYDMATEIKRLEAFYLQAAKGNQP